MKHARSILATFVMPIASAVAVFATQAAQPQTNAAPAATSMTKGEVKKVDKETGKITIKHEPLENLGMLAMSMVFRVKDAAMLDQVKQGDDIRVTAEKVSGAYAVVQLETAP